MKLDVTPDRLIAAPETLTEGGLDLRIIPAPSGETPDALFIQDRKHDLLVVGDAFMPYLGAPFVAEGSPEGFLGAIDLVLQLKPHRLIHGHSPLTALFTMEAMPGLRDAMGALYARSLTAARTARPLADLLHDDFLPQSLRAAPAAVQPYLVTRDTFVQRLYTEQAGYWQANGDGIDAFTRRASGRARSMPWPAAATPRSSARHAIWKGVATRRWRFRSPSWGWRATRRAPLYSRSASAR